MWPKDGLVGKTSLVEVVVVVEFEACGAAITPC
jgi:hypothetical protein